MKVTLFDLQMVTLPSSEATNMFTRFPVARNSAPSVDPLFVSDILVGSSLFVVAKGTSIGHLWPGYGYQLYFSGCRSIPLRKYPLSSHGYTAQAIVTFPLLVIRRQRALMQRLCKAFLHLFGCQG